MKNHKEAFFRTNPSVLTRIKQYAEENPAKHVITKVQQDAGGVSNVTSVSDIPRNRKQVYNQASKIENKKENAFVLGVQDHKKQPILPN